MMVNTIARYNDRQIGRLTKLQAELGEAKKAVDAEVAQQQAQTDVMAKKKKDAETALVKMGGKGQRLRQRQLAPGRAGAAQRQRFVAERELHRRRPDHDRLHHPAHPARGEGGPKGRLHPLLLVLPALRPV